MAFAIFLLIKQVNRFRGHEEPAPAAPSTRECPLCTSTIPIRARRCPQCTADLTAGVS